MNQTFDCNPAKLLGALSALAPHVGYVYVVVLLRIYENRSPCMDAIDALARRTGYDKGKVKAALDELIKADKLFRAENGGLMNRQAESYLTDRVALQQRQGRHGRAGADRRWEKDLLNQQTGDGDPMAPSSDQQNVPYKGVESESKSLDSKESVSEGHRKKTKARCRLPDDFQLDATGYAVAERAGIRGQGARALFERFRDHHKAKGSLMADWPAAWRTWVSNEIRFGQNRRGGGAGGFLDNVTRPPEGPIGSTEDNGDDPTQH